MRTKRTWILGLLGILLLIFVYRVFAVYTVRSGSCRPRPADPDRLLRTRGEPGRAVSFPARTGFPSQRRPLVMMTYNVAGKDGLTDGDHVRAIAAAIVRIRPDIVALQEVHRGTWQARFRDQLAELEARTGLQGTFSPSYVQGDGGYGNAILTRGEIVATRAHPLPCIGEPRTLLEATIRIDRATIRVYATHLTTWGRLNSAIRTEQLRCIADLVRTSRDPYILAGDFNAPPQAPEMDELRVAVQLATQAVGPTHRLFKEQIDHVFTDHGWRVRAAKTWPVEASDHLPVTAELLWGR